MPILVNGFNRFNQLNCLQLGIQHSVVSENKGEDYLANTLSNSKSKLNEFKLLSYETCTLHCDILFSWSYCIFTNRDTFWFCGFLGGKNDSVRPVKAPHGNTILQSSCNRRQLLCVTEEGCLWQYNIDSDLWKDLTPILHSEVADDMLPFVVSRVCCGEMVTAVLTSTGDVFNFPNKLNLPEGVKIKEVACGRSHVLMLSEKGQVFTVGEGSRGQLGHGELEGEEEPRLVEGLAGLPVVTVACGGWHSCAVTADGDFYTWGWNVCGQLGLKRTKGSSGVSVQALPAVIDWPGGQDVRVRSVACGARHTVTLSDDGSVWGCGWNGYGQLALPEVDSVDEMTRMAVPEGITVKRVVCGPWNTCLVT